MDCTYKLIVHALSSICNHCAKEAAGRSYRRSSPFERDLLNGGRRGCTMSDIDCEEETGETS